jgi:prohibitin 2
MQPKTETEMFFYIFKRIALGLFAFIFILSTFVTVATGEMGVKTRFGKVIGTMEPGFHMKKPFIEKVTKIEVRNRVIKNEHYVNEKGETISDNALSAASNDLQEVQVSTTVNYSINPAFIVEVYSKYRTAGNFEEGVIKPAIKQIVKTETAKYTANELVGKRDELNARVSESLKAYLADSFVFVEQSNVTNVEFSPAFTASIEKKVTAEQDALAAKNKLEQVKYEGEQKVVSAKAEAESIRIQSQAINSQGGEDYVNLKSIEKWNGVLPAQMIPGSTVPFINLTN